MKIIIPGTPIAKDRHRCGCTNTRKPFTYDPQSKGKMQAVRQFMIHEFNKAFDSEDKQIVIEASQLSVARSFNLTCTFLFPIPRSFNTAQKNALLWGIDPMDKKPDLDNLEKFYMDAATGVLWDDDCKVVVNHSNKMYSENPRTEMVIMANKDFSVDERVRHVLEVMSPEKLKEFLRDVRAFWPWPSERVDEVVETSTGKFREGALTAVAHLLSEFASKHSDIFKKLSKQKFTNSNAI